jgi:hypothetical protein
MEQGTFFCLTTTTNLPNLIWIKTQRLTSRGVAMISPPFPSTLFAASNRHVLR